ncbi:T9SS type A sorting domain-containing protein [Flavobacterium sp.]|uniref:T9SS type A sorting domain-containing protein n=1 Tax=Flavobacterium sp. TaxID=239 RepID=UPI00286DD56C|nr:T9SS type A sorting domain-containing protein [Flavobacterium sp.]
MKKLLLLLILFSNGLLVNAQIGGGWDWAFNTGTLGGATIKHMKYTADGSEILFGGSALAAAYFGSTTLTAPPPLAGYPGSIKFFGKINSATGVPTIIRSFSNIPLNFDCITTDNVGNFYTGGAFVSTTEFDLGNGVIIPASAFKMNVIVKFNATGNAIWAKTFSMGTLGAANNVVFKLAVSNAGNVFFTGLNFNTNNRPLYKLDSNGNTLWFKNASGAGIGTSNNPSYLADKFIDDNENVHYFVYGTGTAGVTFDGVAYPVASASVGYSTLISLNASGNVFNAKTYAGAVSHFQVNRINGNLSFCWNQLDPNPSPFAGLPFSFASISPAYAFYSKVFMEIDKNLNFIKAKDLLINNPFALTTDDYNQYLNLPNGKLLLSINLTKTVIYSAGVDSFYPAEPVNYASAILETDTNWEITKFISGGKAPYTSQSNIAAFNDTYLIAAGFDAAAIGTASTNLPTTSFGSVTLTGMNAATNITTAYGSFSNFRTDVALAQCKSSNFPTIASTTWLGTTNNWDTASNWSNGVPSNTMKALFNQATANYPTVSTTPTAASLEINSGVSLTLPATLALSGAIKNDGTIILNNAGFFQGFGVKEWNGSGSVNFTGTPATLFFANFENALILNTNLTTFYDLKVPTVSLNTAKINLNNKKLSITDSSPTAILGASTTNYIYGGTLERKINSTGDYEFPLGDFSKIQSATISTNNLVGVDKIAVKYNDGAITGTTPNADYSGITITSALNGGWFSISPNQQPTSGTYDAILKIQSSTNLSATVGNYVVIKRDNSTSAWSVGGNYTLGSEASGMVTARNNGLTSFSDFAIGIASSPIVLSNPKFQKQQLTIYPNPAKEHVSLSFKTILDYVNVKIISIAGQTVYEKSNLSGNNLTFNVSDLTKGIYIIQVSDGTSVSTSKFIKQ